MNIANIFAPEHLELMVKNPKKVLDKVRNAGSVFLGSFTPEALGIIWPDTNHILPRKALLVFHLRWEFMISINV